MDNLITEFLQALRGTKDVEIIALETTPNGIYIRYECESKLYEGAINQSLLDYIFNKRMDNNDK